MKNFVGLVKERGLLDAILDKLIGIIVPINNSKQTDQVLYTRLGRLVIFLVMTAIFASLTNIDERFYYGVYVFLVYPIALTLKMMLYAWILNPIRNFKHDKRVRNNYKRISKEIKNGSKEVVLKYPAENDDTYVIYNIVYQNTITYDEDMVKLTAKTKNEWGTIPYIYDMEFKNLAIKASIPVSKAFDKIATDVVYSFDEYRTVKKK